MTYLKHCPSCGAPLTFYHEHGGPTRAVCSAKCQGWKVVETSIIMWVGIGDEGTFPYWPSLSPDKMACKALIYDNLYKPFGDKPDWLKFTLRQVEIRWLDAEMN